MKKVFLIFVLLLAVNVQAKEPLIRFHTQTITFESETRNIAFKYLLCSHYFKNKGMTEKSGKLNEIAAKLYGEIGFRDEYYLDYGRTEYLVPLNKLIWENSVRYHEAKYKTTVEAGFYDLDSFGCNKI